MKSTVQRKTNRNIPWKKSLCAGMLLISVTQVWAETPLLLAEQLPSNSRLEHASPTPQQTHVVEGTVIDAKGEPLLGVTVRVKGTKNAVVTDLDGHFKIQVQRDATLELSYVGYTPKEIKATSTNKPIVLEEDSKVLNEVVVTALGIKRAEKALSYNVQKVTADELTRNKDANCGNSLVGKVAGVQINAGAGGAGSAVRVVMRGTKSIEKSNNVLYVIDGIPMYNHAFGGGEGAYSTPMGSESSADINPEDIESVNMLTGPSAAALYGSDAANGVVIINTKRGSKDKTSVTVSNSSTFSCATFLPKIQNSYGTSSGLMSWGAKQAGDFDIAKFFNTGSNIINSVSLSTGNSRNQTYLT